MVASTTSTRDSGLFEYLMPIFKQKTGITVKVLAQGTGKALDTARRWPSASDAFQHSRLTFTWRVIRQSADHLVNIAGENPLQRLLVI